MFEAEFFQQKFGWAKTGNAALQQVEADEGGKPEPVAAVIQWAGFHSQGNGKKNKTARHDADDTFDSHVNSCFEYYKIKDGALDRVNYVEIQGGDKISVRLHPRLGSLPLALRRGAAISE